MRARATWVFIVAVVWMLVGAFARVGAEIILQWVPFATAAPLFLSLPTLAEIGAMAAASVVAYFLVKLLRSTVGAPAQCWLGVAAAETIKIVPRLAGITVLALGARPDWLQLVLITSDSGVVSLGSQIGYFFFGDVLSLAIVVFGAWRGSLALVEGHAEPARA